MTKEIENQRINIPVIKTLPVDINSETINVEYFIRPGNKQTVLYIHGLGCSKSNFLEAANSESLNGHTLISLDLPGHGNTPYPKKSLNIDNLVELVYKFVSQLGMKDIFIIGHSMGGLIGLLLTEMIKNAKGFINIEGILSKEDCTYTREFARDDVDEFQRRFRKLIKACLLSENPGMRKYGEDLGHIPSSSAFHDYCSQMTEYSDKGDLIERFRRLKTPKLFLYGSNTDSINYIPELKDKGIPVHKISHSKHFPSFDNPTELYQLIGNFLEQYKS